MFIATDITTLKHVWAVTAGLCVCVHLATLAIAAGDWRYVLCNSKAGEPGTKELRIRAWTSMRGEISMLFLQGLLLAVRVGWIFGPNPLSPVFARWWERDASTLAIGQTVLAIHCVMSLWDRRRTISLLRHRAANRNYGKALRAQDRKCNQ